MVNPESGGYNTNMKNGTEEEDEGSRIPDGLGNHEVEILPLVPLNGTTDPTATAIVVPEASNESTVKRSNDEFRGLTKEQLEEFVKNPFWKKMRLIFFILFWLIWVAMLAAVIIIIVVSPKCPHRPNRQFWQKPFYRLQVKSFAPAGSADPMAVGSLQGLALKIDYLRQTLGFNNFIIDSLVSTATPTGCPADFKSMNSSLGGLDTLKTLTKQGRKKGFSILMEFDASQADIDWLSKDGGDGFLSAADASGELPKMASRNGGWAWYNKRLHLPRYGCPSINVTSPAVQAKLEDALEFWLDAGLSGFVLTNVAFMSPTPVAASGVLNERWFDANPTPLLFSNASVDFVRSVRRFINAQAEKRGRELALFVDFGNTGFPQPEARQAAYLDVSGGAHAVVSTGLGVHLSSLATKEARPTKQVIQETITAVGDSGSVLFATAWPSLRRPSESFWTGLSLTLPGVPCLYYGQELGMGHVPGVTFADKWLSSYLTGDDSTDASETPMQWSDNRANAGWLANDTTSLAWINLTLRSADLERHSLQRLSSAGHPFSELQLVQRLVQLINTKESLQWGPLTFLTGQGSGADLLAFKRHAARFPSVVVVVNMASRPTTVELNNAGSDTGTLKVMHSSAPDVASSYQVDKDYSLSRVFAPAKSILVFIGKDE